MDSSENSKTLKTKSGKPLKIGTGTGTSWKRLKLSRPKDEKGNIVEELVSQLILCLELGYYHIDTAEVYATHDEIGVALKRSKLRREDIFITSKFNGGIEEAPRTSSNPTEAIDKILKELDTDYIDLFLVHQPFFDEDESNLTIESVWEEMVAIKKSGKARHIGVSNFTKDHIGRIISTFSPTDHPEVNQIEFHPYLQNQSPGIVEYCRNNNIVIEAYAPLAPLFRTDEVDGKERIHPLSNLLPQLAKKYDKTSAQILLNYCIQKSIIPITTSSKKHRIEESLNAYSFKLEIEDINSLDEAGERSPYHSFFKGMYE